MLPSPSTKPRGKDMSSAEQLTSPPPLAHQHNDDDEDDDATLGVDHPLKLAASSDDGMFHSAYENIPLDDDDDAPPPPVTTNGNQTHHDVAIDNDEPQSMASVLRQHVDLTTTTFPPTTSTSEAKSISDEEDEGNGAAQATPPRLASVDLSSAEETARKLRSLREISDESDDEEFIHIAIAETAQVGEGISAYILYKLQTETSIPAFRQRSFSVMRRFSDFLGLYEKLLEKHAHTGRFVPPAPEKSVFGSNKLKPKTSDAAAHGDAPIASPSSATAIGGEPDEFIIRRRASLERFINRVAQHPVLRLDPDFREFVEADGQLPKASNTSAFSVAAGIRFISRFGEQMTKMTYKMEEKDPWFEEKQQHIDAMEQSLKRVHFVVESLVAHRKEMAQFTGQFAQSTALLASCEEHQSLARALAQLSEGEERIEAALNRQASDDYFLFSELIKDYIGLIGSVKEALNQREKTYQQWQQAILALAKRRELKARADLEGRVDKVQRYNEEVREWQNRVEKGESDFESISALIKKEFERFDRQRQRDFITTLVRYLKQLIEHQKEMIKTWEEFQPKAKSISST